MDRNKIRRLVIAALIGANAAGILFWALNWPLLVETVQAEISSWRGDGVCDVRGCENTSWAHWTETENPSSPITEEFCEFHYRTLVRE